MQEKLKTVSCQDREIKEKYRSYIQQYVMDRQLAKEVSLAVWKLDALWQAELLASGLSVLAKKEIISWRLFRVSLKDAELYCLEACLQSAPVSSYAANCLRAASWRRGVHLSGGLSHALPTTHWLHFSLRYTHPAKWSWVRPIGWEAWHKTNYNCLILETICQVRWATFGKQYDWIIFQSMMQHRIKKG